ncbi:TPA: hypothetical protein ACP32N_006538 [Pseudomonas aeruginosa]
MDNDVSLDLPASEDENWQPHCGVQKIMQVDPFGCGIACLAMVWGKTYKEAQEHFISQGLGNRRGGRSPFSTTSREMRMALATAGLMTTTRRWRGWSNFTGLCVMKVRDKSATRANAWHWAVAFHHPEFEYAVFDPQREWPGFKRMPEDTLCTLWESFRPFGDVLLVEQKFQLAPQKEPK